MASRMRAARMTVALDMIDAEMAGRTWAMGDEFTMADCAAAPPLFYINKLFPLGGTHKNAAAYLQRLLERPSYARAIEEAKPYFSMLPDLTARTRSLVPMLKIFAVIGAVVVVGIAVVLILAAMKPDTFRVSAQRRDQGAAGEDLPADQRFQGLGRVVALGEQGPGDEADLQRHRPAARARPMPGTATAMSAPATC